MRRAHRWRPSSQTRSTLLPSPPELPPRPESARPVQPEVVQQAQEVLELPAPLLQALPPESLEPQVDALEQESPVSTEEQLLLLPPLQLQPPQ